MSRTTDKHEFTQMQNTEGQSEFIRVNQWFYSPEHGELCRVIETQTLWGETVCRVWLPGKDTVVRLPAGEFVCEVFIFDVSPLRIRGFG